MHRRLHAQVSGTVQGVAFRWYTQIEASRLGLVGSVVNLPDGRVDVVAEGEPTSLQHLEAWLAVGSPSAEVDEVQTQYADATGEFTEFSIVQYGSAP